tara:strand:+ start:2940 stop:3419 length:480 start_codon:yes stop_codon:yes gene_type:complete
MNNVDKMTLQYLLNPNIFDKINSSKEDNSECLEKFKNYKTKIMELTEDMFDNNFMNDDIKENFKHYCKNLIYHINNQKMNKLVQEEYKDYKPKIKKNKLLIDLSNNSFNDLSFNINTNIEKNKKVNDLNSFIIKNSKNNKNSKNSKNIILPKKKNLNDN